MSNLNNCSSAVGVHVNISGQLFEMLESVNNPLFSLEDRLLRLATSDSTESVMYSAVIEIGSHTIVRYFEHGRFQVCLRCSGKKLHEVFALDWSYARGPIILVCAIFNCCQIVKYLYQEISNGTLSFHKSKTNNLAQCGDSIRTQDCDM